VENLEGWTRSYGDRQIYRATQTKQALSGTVEWSDVFLEAAGQDPVNVSSVQWRKLRTALLVCRRPAANLREIRN